MSKKTIAMEVGHWWSDDRGDIDGMRKFRELVLNLETGREIKRQIEHNGFDMILNGDWGNFPKDKPMIEYYNEKRGNTGHQEWVDDNQKKVLGGNPLKDFYNELEGRKDIAVGIAIHFNAAGNGEPQNHAQGFVAFTQTDSSQNDNMKVDSKTLSQSIANKIKEDTKQIWFANEPVRTSKGTGWEELITKFSAPFAYCEFGFMDNEEDRKNFDTPEKQKELGKAAAKGIIKYLATLPEYAGLVWKDADYEEIYMFEKFPTLVEYTKIPEKRLIFVRNLKSLIYNGVTYNGLYRISNGCTYYKGNHHTEGNGKIFSFDGFPTFFELSKIPDKSLIFVRNRKNHIFDKLFRISNGNAYCKGDGNYKISENIFAFDDFPTLFEYNNIPNKSLMIVHNVKNCKLDGLFRISNGCTYYKD